MFIAAIGKKWGGDLIIGKRSDNHIKMANTLQLLNMIIQLNQKDVHDIPFCGQKQRQSVDRCVWPPPTLLKKKKSHYVSGERSLEWFIPRYEKRCLQRRIRGRRPRGEVGSLSF